MVELKPKTLGNVSRRIQIIHTILLLIFLVYIGLSPAFHLKLESGQSFRISALQGPVGSFLFWSALLLIAAQITSFRRLNSITVIAYSWIGTSFIFAGFAVPAGESLLNSEVDNLSRVIDWMAKEVNRDFGIADVYIEIGVAWNLMVVAGSSLIILSLALLMSSSRLRNRYDLEESLH